MPDIDVPDSEGLGLHSASQLNFPLDSDEDQDGGGNNLNDGLRMLTGVIETILAKVRVWVAACAIPVLRPFLPPL